MGYSIQPSDFNITLQGLVMFDFLKNFGAVASSIIATAIAIHLYLKTEKNSGLWLILAICSIILTFFLPKTIVHELKNVAFLKKGRKTKFDLRKVFYIICAISLPSAAIWFVYKFIVDLLTPSIHGVDIKQETTVLVSPFVSFDEEFDWIGERIPHAIVDYIGKELSQRSGTLKKLSIGTLGTNPIDTHDAARIILEDLSSKALVFGKIRRQENETRNPVITFNLEFKQDYIDPDTLKKWGVLEAYFSNTSGFAPGFRSFNVDLETRISQPVKCSLYSGLGIIEYMEKNLEEAKDLLEKACIVCDAYKMKVNLLYANFFLALSNHQLKDYTTRDYFAERVFNSEGAKDRFGIAFDYLHQLYIKSKVDSGKVVLALPDPTNSDFGNPRVRPFGPAKRITYHIAGRDTLWGVKEYIMGEDREVLEEEYLKIKSIGNHYYATLASGETKVFSNETNSLIQVVKPISMTNQSCGDIAIREVFEPNGETGKKSLVRHDILLEDNVDSAFCVGNGIIIAFQKANVGSHTLLLIPVEGQEKPRKHTVSKIELKDGNTCRVYVYPHHHNLLKDFGAELVPSDTLIGYFNIFTAALFEPRFTYGRPFVSNKALVGANGSWGIISDSFDYVLPIGSISKEPYFVENDLFILERKSNDPGKFAIYDLSKDFPPIFSIASFRSLNNNFFIIENDVVYKNNIRGYAKSE